MKTTIKIKMVFKCEKPEECPICYESLNVDEPLSCGHWMHKCCVVKSRKDECPICREKIDLTTEERVEITSLKVKGSTLYSEEKPIDFIYESLIGNIDADSSNHFVDMLDEAENLCDEVAIIDHGKIVTQGAPQALIAQQENCHSLEALFIQLTGRSVRDH